jgi:serine/threonine-protein kinase
VDESEEPDALVGTTLAHTYTLDKVLGEGSMGRVYLARHTRIASKRFAVKVLHTQYARHAEALERFKREAEAAGLISSPHVVGVQDYGRTPDGRPFLVNDFLVGEELADRLLREGQLPIGEAVRIVRQICSGLAVAHASGIIHRDVKPENVFLVGADDDLTAMLLDFGISRFHDGGKTLTQAGTTLGTPDFMAPEQARGQPVDHRADIYAVGVMLYAMVTGVMPFERESAQETLLALLTEEAPPPRLVEPSIPEHLETIIMRAMAKELPDRYQWIAELSQALAPYDPSHAPSSGSPSAEQASSGVLSAPAAAAMQEAYAATPAATSGKGAIVVSMMLGVPASFTALLLAVAGVLQEGEVELTGTVWLIAAISLAIMLATPLVLALRAIAAMWRQPARTQRAGRALGAALAASCTIYTLGALALRLILTAELDVPELGALTDPLLFVFAAFAGGMAYLVRRG